MYFVEEKEMENPTSWEEWRKQKERLYLGEDGKPLPEPLRLMIAWHGRAKTKKTCADCIHCVSEKHPVKRDEYRLICDSSNRKADWDPKWPACGAYHVRKEPLTNDNH